MTPWRPAPHLLAIDRIATDAVRGKLGKVVIAVEAPPRHGKSEFVSTYLPSWYLGRWPTKRVVLASYGDSLARRFGRRCRDLLERFGSWYGLQGIREDVSGASDWDLQGFPGGMQTAGVGGPITGRGADLLIIDDPIKNAEEAISQAVRDRIWDWFISTAWTRIEPGGVCFVMMTRWHEDDLIGRLVKLAEEPEGEGVEPFEISRLTLPALAEPSEKPADPLGRKQGEALWPERWAAGHLRRQKTVLGDYWFNSLYQQRPGQYGRSEWPDEYFAAPLMIEEDALPSSFDWQVLTLDPSKGKETGDFCAIVWLGLNGGKLFVDARVERLPTPQLCARLVEVYRKRGAMRVGVEANHFQELLAPEIARAAVAAGLPPLPISLITNSVNKQLRIARLGPYLEQHAFRIVRSPGALELIRQLKAFPLGDYDDGPDALEMAVRLLDHLIRVAGNEKDD